MRRKTFRVIVGRQSDIYSTLWILSIVHLERKKIYLNHRKKSHSLHCIKVTKSTPEHLPSQILKQGLTAIVDLLKACVLFIYFQKVKGYEEFLLSYTPGRDRQQWRGSSFSPELGVYSQPSWKNWRQCPDSVDWVEAGFPSGESDVFLEKLTRKKKTKHLTTL